MIFSLLILAFSYNQGPKLLWDRPGHSSVQLHSKEGTRRIPGTLATWNTWSWFNNSGTTTILGLVVLLAFGTSHSCFDNSNSLHLISLSLSLCLHKFLKKFKGCDSTNYVNFVHRVSTLKFWAVSFFSLQAISSTIWMFSYYNLLLIFSWMISIDSRWTKFLRIPKNCLLLEKIGSEARRTARESARLRATEQNRLCWSWPNSHNCESWWRMISTAVLKVLHL